MHILFGKIILTNRNTNSESYKNQSKIFKDVLKILYVQKYKIKFESIQNSKRNIFLRLQYTFALTKS